MSAKMDDKVKVIAGKEKSREGTVIKVDRKNGHVVVRGLNVIKKHGKPSQANRNGGVVEKEGSIRVSNVMLIDPESGKPAGIGRETVDGNRVHAAKVSGKAIDKKQRGGS